MEYYYVRNGQGDITGLIDSTGTQVVSYTYDAWGKLVATSGTLASTVGEKNPYRYRGYRYDAETGLYYCQSRYYAPEWGRWINTDSNIGVTGAVITHNLFAYCSNNPILLSDPEGDFYRLALAGGATLSLGGGSGIGATILAALASITPAGWVAIGVVTLVSVGAILFANSKSNSNNKGITGSTPANPNNDFDPRNPKRWNKNSTQTTSKTLYNKNGYRLDVENPNPSQRPGQLHVQVGSSKYLFNNITGKFYTAAGALAPKAVQNLLNNSEFIKKLNDGLRILGLPLF